MHRTYASTKSPTTRPLSAARRQLLALCKQLGYGRLEQVAVRGGEPVLEPSPVVIQEFKFGSPTHNSYRGEQSEQAIGLFELFDSLRDGTIAVLSVKCGLPFLAEVKIA